MPRYYRRRYTRVVRPKKKWASNIKVWQNSSFTGDFAIPLATNNVQTGTPTPSILKVGNFKISADIHVQTTEVYTGNPVCVGYILYVPEGWTASPTGFRELIDKHPEWIMATKTMGGNYSSNAVRNFSVDSLNMSTRLKRNLNSGDQVVFFVTFSLEQGVSYLLTGTCRYWTCSN